MGTVKIAHIEFQDKPLFLSPMENVSDYVFRQICLEHGADAVVTEFVNAKMLLANPDAFAGKMRLSVEKIPQAIQIYGKDPLMMADAAQIAESKGASFIDINFGCSVKKIASKGAGAGLLDHPQRMMEICRSVKNAVQIPVTAKTRLGADRNTIIIEKLIKGFQDEGLSAVFVHGRTREQLYSGFADWEVLGRLKEITKAEIPVIGNGDITTPEIALERLAMPGIDGIMIGRACIKHPWIFSDIKDFEKKGKYNSHTLKDRLTLLNRHIQANMLQSDEKSGILHSRRFIASILKQAKVERELFLEALKATSFEILNNALSEIEKKYGQDEFTYPNTFG